LICQRTTSFFLGMINKVFKIASAALVISLFSGCGGSSDPNPETDALDRIPMLTHWVDNIIIPSYDNFKVKFDAMAAASAAFTGAPGTETLIAFRAKWVDAYTEWQKVELLEVGPAETNAIRNFYNVYPTDVTGIMANIDNPTVNLGVPTAYPRQGFPALDYLINGAGPNDATIVAWYTTDADAAKRRAYVTRLTERMGAILGTVISEWKPYRATY
jgi:predicted lipoprotein